jgi:hypothetical protein
LLPHSSVCLLYKYNIDPINENATPDKKEIAITPSQLQTQNGDIILPTPASDMGSLPIRFSLFLSMPVSPQTSAYQFPMSNQKTLFLFLA